MARRMGKLNFHRRTLNGAAVRHQASDSARVPPHGEAKEAFAGDGLHANALHKIVAESPPRLRASRLLKDVVAAA